MRLSLQNNNKSTPKSLSLCDEMLYLLEIVIDFAASKVDYQWIPYQASTDKTYDETLIQRLSNECNNTFFEFPRNSSTKRIESKIQLKHHIN